MLSPWKESHDKPRKQVKKQRHHFADKSSTVKAMVFLVLMYGCESWIIKKAECQRIDASNLWCWRRLLKFPCTARRSNQLILKEINSEYSLEGLMLNLKITCGNLMWRANSLEKTLILGKTEGRRRGWQKMRWLDGIIDTMDLGLSKFWKTVKDGETWHAALHWVAKSQTWLGDWTTTNLPNESWEMNNKIIQTLLWNIKYLDTVKMCVDSCQCHTDNWFYFVSCT